MNIQIKRCGPYAGNLPSYATTGSAGMDLHAAIEEQLIIPAGGIVMVPTGIAIALPSGYECQVRSRSGLAAKSGVFALNAPGTIDSDYRGEIKVILANFSKQDYIVQSQERIAQIVIAAYTIVEWNPVDELTETERGTGGFGSTGII
ncbi:deoxyuridine 5'-triphosphate nucleotidohydrolase [Chlorobiota bacterium]|nr:deoxyuridine 5'-triphosphate nucleotidohydrolase [Chlorobiota bacterium]